VAVSLGGWGDLAEGPQSGSPWFSQATICCGSSILCLVALVFSCVCSYFDEKMFLGTPWQSLHAIISCIDAEWSYISFLDIGTNYLPMIRKTLFSDRYTISRFQCYIIILTMH